MNYFDVENDPFTNNTLDVEDGTSFVALSTEKYFQLDYSQFMGLIRSSYETANIFDKNFVQYISFGVFQYYCVLLLWLRLYLVRSERGLKTSEMSNLNKTINFTLPIPADIKLYLDGIGDLKDATGCKYLIDIQGTLSRLQVNGAQGSYGKMKTSNFIIYETLPSLLISLLKIQADLLAAGNENWNLPAQLKPNHDGVVIPNKNLLGWWPAEKLTNEQRTVILNAKITTSDFGVLNIDFLPVNVLLIKYVAEKVQQLNMGTMPSSTYGSIAQVAFTSRALEDASIDNMKNIAEKLGRTNSYIPMPKHIATASATFRYRLKRYERGLFDMVGYEFISNNIPDEILKNENQIFEFGVGIEIWQRSDYRISEQSGRSLINAFTMELRNKYSKSKFSVAARNYTIVDNY